MPMRLTDVVVVGAGPAGTAAASSLAAAGRSVLLLEAGPRLPITRTLPPEPDRRLWSCATAAEPWDWTRVRAVGGRSLLWGGWSARFPEQVLDRGGWPYTLAELAPWYDAAERHLLLVTGRLDARYEALAAEASVAIHPKRAPLVRGGALWTARRTAGARRAHTHHVVTRLEHEGGKAVAVDAVDLRTERGLRLQCRAVVLAPSPLETTRILLASEAGDARIGRGLVDHMVSSWVLVEPAPAPPARGRGRFPGQATVDRFVNVGGDTERPYRGGFTLELSGPHPLEDLDLERLVPASERDTTRGTLIHAIGELTPLAGRRVDLDPVARDALGRPLPRVHWRWAPEEHTLAEDLVTACTQLADALALPGSRLVRLSDPLVAGAGHEAGTAAMGLDGACDGWGRLRALTNVWVADASALPTAGDRHPTLTVVAHALRAAADVHRALG